MLTEDSDYPARFADAFPNDPTPITLDNLIRAIASFERTLVSGNSAYDQLLFRDDTEALSGAAMRGMRLFFSDRIGCSQCHNGLNLSGPVQTSRSPTIALEFSNTGLTDSEASETPVDEGLFQITREPADKGHFRAPTLRNIAVTGPYMHDGRIATLEAVIEHYATGGQAPAGRASSLIRTFAVTSDEMHDLIEFLRSLTDTRFLSNPRFSDPFAR
jgi:cytochrome c peroxidase